MPWLEGFLVGFTVGVIGMTVLFVLLRKRAGAQKSAPGSEGIVPHTDEKSASQIGHDRGIEVFDD